MRQKKSIYKSAYTIGVSVFTVLVVLVTVITITVTKSCNPINKNGTITQDTIVGKIDTVYLPNPNAVKVQIHDTIYKTLPCTKKHCDNPKSTKDTSK